MPRSPAGTHLPSYLLFQGVPAFIWTQSFFYPFPLRLIPFSKDSSFLLVCGVFNCVQLFVTPWAVALQAPLSMEFSGKNTALGCHSLLQGIFPTQGSNPGLLYCRQILLPLSHLGGLLRSKLKLSLSIQGSDCLDTGNIVSTTQVPPREEVQPQGKMLRSEPEYLGLILAFLLASFVTGLCLSVLNYLRN